MSALEYRCSVKSNRMLTPTVFEIAFETDQPLDFTAGQFVSVVVPGAGPKGRDLRRAYSIASTPHVRPIELCVKIVDGGPGTQYLHSLRPGDSLRVYAPYGDFVYHSEKERYVCFIATGTGIAPFRSILQSKSFQANKPLGSFCFMGVRTADELLYDDFFSTCPGLNYVAAVSRPESGWTRFKGRVTDHIRTLNNDFPWLKTEYYLCGNGAMITEVKGLLAEKGVQKDSIHQEIYYK